MAKRENIKAIQQKKEMEVEINLPSCIQIELLQGHELRHYEIFFLLTTLTLTIAVGFWTSYFTMIPNNPLKFSAIVFSIFSAITFSFTIYYRFKLYNGKVRKVATLKSFK